MSIIRSQLKYKCRSLVKSASVLQNRMNRGGLSSFKLAITLAPRVSVNKINFNQ